MLFFCRNPNLHYFAFLPFNFDQFRGPIDKLQFLKGMAVDESLINHDVLSHVHQCCPDFLELKVFALYAERGQSFFPLPSEKRIKKLCMRAAIKKFMFPEGFLLGHIGFFRLRQYQCFVLKKAWGEHLHLELKI